MIKLYSCLLTCDDKIEFNKVKVKILSGKAKGRSLPVHIFKIEGKTKKDIRVKMVANIDTLLGAYFDFKKNQKYIAN